MGGGQTETITNLIETDIKLCQGRVALRWCEKMDVL
jgi:hypothetical protein